MKVDDVLLAGDELRIARVGGNETIEALAEMTDGDGMCFRRAADRQIQVDEGGAAILTRQQKFPPSTRSPREHRVVFNADFAQGSLTRVIASR